MRYYNLFVEETNSLYTYADLEDEYEIGMIVEVKFRNRDKIGVIIERSQEEKFDYKVNNILRKYPIDLQYNEKYIKLLKWLKNYYLTGYFQIFSMGINRREKVKTREIYKIIRDIEAQTDLEKKLVKYFKKKESITAIYVEKKFTTSEIKELIEAGIIKKEKEEIVLEREAEEFCEVDEAHIVTLNEEQQNALNTIENGDERYFLLKGITGSGKTEIYISLMKKALSQGKGSIFLLPEISLTPQMILRFKKEFGGNIAVLHSKMSKDEVAREWTDISRGIKKIVIGVRSAIFAPLKDIGYIIIDEEHENTYKQDSSPRYHARMVALKKAEIEGCKLVLGSATPSVESYYYAKQGAFKLVELNKRFNDAKLPQIEIVDMKDEEHPYFSRKLLHEIKERIIKKEQVVLFLNRKGYSTYIQCKACGHVEECPHCSVKYSYYLKENMLKCNYCGIAKRYTGRCSSCGSTDILQSGLGVEKIQESLQEIFQAATIRVDSESSKEKDFHSKMYQDFLEEKYSIMIGTQMIAKGFHFPNVTLVGVINGDSSLNFPDFRASERTYQLLTQVSGRAGRGDKPGEVIIQTYQPENFLYKNILQGDYESFYEKEIEDRKIFGYPPYSKMINIGISSNREEELFEFSKKIKEEIEDREVEIYGPMKSLVYKVKDRFRINLIIKGERRKIEIFKRKLLKVMKDNEKNSRYRIVIDVDPLNLI